MTLEVDPLRTYSCMQCALYTVICPVGISMPSYYFYSGIIAGIDWVAGQHAPGKKSVAK